jgi:hypothetical protein
VDITRAVEDGIRELAPEAHIEFKRVAVTPEQIGTWNLPTRPTKATDSSSNSFEGDSVEVDAIAPDDLRELASNCIVQHIDGDALDRLRLIEEQERLTLVSVIKNLPEIQAKLLTVRERPNEKDRKTAKQWGVDAQIIADRRVLKRDAPDLLTAADRSTIDQGEAMQILEARKRASLDR